MSQNQQIDFAFLIIDIYLIKLILINSKLIDFSHNILIAKLIEESTNFVFKVFFKNIDSIDFNKFAIFAQILLLTKKNSLRNLKKL